VFLIFAELLCGFIGEFMAYKGKSGITKQEVLEILRDKILYLDFKPGEQLSDVDIAEELNVSRTPVREALLKLQGEKFVDIFPQSGTFVSLLDLSLIKEILYVRHVLECELIRKLFDTDITLKPKLDRYIILQELAVTENNQKEYVKNDHLLHKEIFNLAGHVKSWEMLEPTYSHTVRFHVLDFHDKQVFGTSLYEHKLIIKYFDERNKDKLEEILDIHHDCNLRTSESLIVKYKDWFCK